MEQQLQSWFGGAEALQNTPCDSFNLSPNRVWAVFSFSFSADPRARVRYFSRRFVFFFSADPRAAPCAPFFFFFSRIPFFGFFLRFLFVFSFFHVFLLFCFRTIFFFFTFLFFFLFVFRTIFFFFSFLFFLLIPIQNLNRKKIYQLQIVNLKPSTQ
jgi:hypothetical protein